jgi:SAM-dependent methyltransferase
MSESEHDGGECLRRGVFDYNAGLAALKEACLGSSERTLLAERIADVFARRSIAMLDIGSGNGVVTRKLMHDMEMHSVNAHVTCVEPNPTGPWQVYESDKMKLVVGGFEEVTFESAFDVITSIHSIYYVGSLSVAVKKMSSLLAPGGLLLILVWESSCILYQAATILQGSRGQRVISADDVFLHVCDRWSRSAVTRLHYEGPLAIPFFLRSPKTLQSLASVIIRDRNSRINEEVLRLLADHLRQARTIELRRNSLIIVRAPGACGEHGGA